jgi:transcriptional regulator with XRE-family HTH domain
MALAKALNMSRPVISRAENEREAVPSDPVIRLIAKATRADLPELLELARRARAPRTYFARWAQDFESRATLIRWFEPLLIPGFLQTESYARSVLSWKPNSDGMEDNLRERLERQSIVNRAELRVLVLSSVLDREIAEAAVMTEQLDHLLNIASRTTVTLQIVPDTPAVAGALGGAFGIATEGNSDVAAYSGSLVNGSVHTDPELITRAVRLFDALRGEALTWRASVDQMTESRQRWATA